MLSLDLDMSDDTIAAIAQHITSSISVEALLDFIADIDENLFFLTLTIWLIFLHGMKLVL